MARSESKWVRGAALCGLRKAGDSYCPGSSKLPPFSALPFTLSIDRVLDYVPEGDRSGLVGILAVLGILPRPVVGGLLRGIGTLAKIPGAAGGVFRLLDIGIKGLAYSLYYGNESVTRRMGFDMEVVDEAVKARRASSATARVFQNAREAEPGLRALSVEGRLHYVRNLRKVILAHLDEIVAAVARETGKTATDAIVSDVFSALDHFHYLEKFAGKILRDRKVWTPLSLLGKRSRVFFEPMGTVLVISPWNYPFYQAVVPITAAFVCGNAVLYKPSEHTPLQGLLERLLDEAQFDPSWVQVVYGDGQTGAELISVRPDKIFFTGSVRTGKKIMEAAAKELIPVELELGGKDPMIVFEDANLERATAGALWGALTNLGQSCTSVERVYVQASVYDRFRHLLLERVRRLGPEDLGRMTTAFQVEVVAKHVAEARQRGARILAGENWDGKSPVIPAVVLEDVPPDAAVLRDETFGPVIPLVRFRTEAEAVQLANDSPYGLSASVWSGDSGRAERVARAIRTGNVSINNVMVTEGNPALPFGGIKDSGFGRYKGEWGLYAFSNLKSVIFDANSPKIEAHWFPYTGKKLQLFRALTQAMFGGGILNFLRVLKTGPTLEGEAKRQGKISS